MPTYLDRALWAELYPPAADLSDGAATMILDGVEDAVKTFIGWDPASATVTEYYSPSGEDVITLLRRPVTAITNVWEDRTGYFGVPSDSFDATDTLLTAGTDYVAETGVGGAYTGRLFRLNARWPVAYSRHVGRLASHVAPALGTVKVTYTGGWAAGSPAAVIAACYGEASAVLRHMPGAALASESLDGYSISLQAAQNVVQGETAPFLTGSLKGALRPWRRVAIG